MANSCSMALVASSVGARSTSIASSSKNLVRGVDKRSVHFKDPAHKVVTFNPLRPPGRRDVDLEMWKTRKLPRTQTKPDTVWSSKCAATVLRRPSLSITESMFERVGDSVAVARRNALELAQQLRRPGECACTSWPCYRGVLYLPVPNHMDEETKLHIEGAFDKFFDGWSSSS